MNFDPKIIAELLSREATLEDGAAVAKRIEEVVTPFGLHVALAGGCLTKTGPRKDIDIWLYHRDPCCVLPHLNRYFVVELIETQLCGVLRYGERPYNGLCYANRTVVKFFIDGFAVDIFLDMIAPK